MEKAQAFTPKLDYPTTQAHKAHNQLAEMLEKCKVEVANIGNTLMQRQEIEQRLKHLLEFNQTVKTGFDSVAVDTPDVDFDKNILTLEDLKKQLDEKSGEISEVAGIIPEDSTELLELFHANQAHVEEKLKLNETRQTELRQWLREWSQLSEKISDGLRDLRDNVDFLESNLDNPSLDLSQFAQPAMMKVRDFKVRFSLIFQYLLFQGSVSLTLNVEY